MLTSPDPAPDRRLLVALASLCAALLAACGILAWRLFRAGEGGAVFFGEEALRDPEVQREVVRKLTESNKHPFDSHPDPEVARILVPNGERDGLSTNAIGMRERPFELRKPAGTVRIVLLGDSFVFGLNIPDAERLGAVLERALAARAAGPQPRFECLHLAVNSWNLFAECAFLRRQVDQLRPDLVIQVSVANDLDDVTGVRGFGTDASFAPRHGWRADSIVLDRYAQSFLQHDTRNFLSRGEDFESRARFADALQAVLRLRAVLAELPERPLHLLVSHWSLLAPVFHAHLGKELTPESLVYLPPEFATDKGVWLTPSDPHWNAAGHARVAEFLYGTIRARGLLPGVELAPWPEAEELARGWAARGLEYASTGLARVRETIRDPVAAIDLPGITEEEARQVQGGIDREGLVSPYATFVLHRPLGARELHVAGRALPDRALRGARVQVFLEELELGALKLEPDAPLERRWSIPPALDGRDYLAVRFSASDYVYRGEDLRHCVVFRLERAALE